MSVNTILEKITKDLDEAIILKNKANDDGAVEAFEYFQGKVDALRNILESFV